MEQVVAAVIGGMIAAGAGWFVTLRIEKYRLRQIGSLLALGIRDDLERSGLLYERIASDWKKTNDVWHETLNELRESRQAYLNQRDSLVLFDDAELRKRLFRYYLRSGELVNQLEYEQTRRFAIKRDYNYLAQTIMARGEANTWPEAYQVALSQMKQQDIEYANLNDSTADGIKRIESLISEADQLRKDMKELV